MADAKHFIPERHKPKWMPDGRHKGVDVCAVAGCGVLTMHRERGKWMSAFRQLLSSVWKGARRG